MLDPGRPTQKNYRPASDRPGDDADRPGRPEPADQAALNDLDHPSGDPRSHASGTDVSGHDHDMPTLILGTRNKKKGEELAQLIAPPWEPNPRLGRLTDPGPRRLSTRRSTSSRTPTRSPATPARRRRETALALGHWVLADDSGLAVDALGGAPGVYSARYAGTHGDDEANNRKLLDALADVPDDRRGAAFVCSLALADPSGADPPRDRRAPAGAGSSASPRGEHGFGYDPLFLIPEYHKTFGELSVAGQAPAQPPLAGLRPAPARARSADRGGPEYVRRALGFESKTRTPPARGRGRSRSIMSQSADRSDRIRYGGRRRRRAGSLRSQGSQGGSVVIGSSHCGEATHALRRGEHGGGRAVDRHRHLDADLHGDLLADRLRHADVLAPRSPAA